MVALISSKVLMSRVGEKVIIRATERKEEKPICSSRLSRSCFTLSRAYESCLAGRMERPESGIRNRKLNWERGKLGSTETSSRYPCGNKIQDGVLCYHCFEKFSAQWSWYQRYTHRAKELTFGYLVHACVLLYQTCLHIMLRHFYQKKQTNKIFSRNLHEFIKKEHNH